MTSDCKGELLSIFESDKITDEMFLHKEETEKLSSKWSWGMCTELLLLAWIKQLCGIHVGRKGVGMIEAFGSGNFKKK